MPHAAKEWSGSPYWKDPDNFWIDDETNELVHASTGERSPPPSQPYPPDDE